jgi:hypothetical protein
MHKEDSIIAFVETLGGGPRRSRLSVSRVMGQETVSHPCLGMDHLQWTCSGVEVDFAVDFFAENPHLARVCSDDVNLAGGLTDFRSCRSGMGRPLPSQGNTPYQSIPFRTNTSYGVTAFGPFRLAEMSRPSPRQEKRRDRLSPYASSTCPASRRLTRFQLRVSVRPPAFPSGFALSFVVRCSCCFNHKLIGANQKSPQVPLRPHFLCVEGLAFPITNHQSQIANSSCSFVSVVVNQVGRYSKVMRTISGVVPTRMGGPQVPAPLEV